MGTSFPKLGLFLGLLGLAPTFAHAGGQSEYCKNYDEGQIQQQAEKEQQMLDQSQPLHRRVPELHQWISRQKALLNQAQQDRKQICKFAKEIGDDVDKHMQETKPDAESCKAFEDMVKILGKPWSKLKNATSKIDKAYEQLLEADEKQMQQHKSTIQQLRGKPGVDVNAVFKEATTFYQHGNGKIMRPILDGMHEETERLEKESEKLEEMLKKVQANEQKCKMQKLNEQIKANMANPARPPNPPARKR